VDRMQLKSAIEARLGRRSLVWAGLRGDDVEPIADLAQLSAAMSIIGNYSGRSSVESIAYEELSGVRPDLETWDIDFHLDAEASVEFRLNLLRLLNNESALMPYRSSRFLSAAHFARFETCLDLGLFGGHQSAFDHKPWVESNLAKRGIPTLGWKYIPDVDLFTVVEMARRTPIVLRRSRTSGGEGIELIRDPSEVGPRWPRTPEGIVGVARYVEHAVPVNVGATVWRDRTTVHLPSFQLIGIPSCVTRPFGYCGNDFSAAKQLEPDVIDAIESSTVSIGDWLRSYGYLGTFGVDYLIEDGVPLFTEVNPRFQGSTPASAQLSHDLGQACLLLEHIAAMLGLEALQSMPLRKQIEEVPPLSQVVVHHVDQHAGTPRVSHLVDEFDARDMHVRVDVRPPESVVVEHGATTCRLTLSESVTTTGFDLRADLTNVITAWRVAEVEHASVQ
jgi:formate-dependent phosphoribosylglycinamide formyltransferase (GAR transformylase)